MLEVLKIQILSNIHPWVEGGHHIADCRSERDCRRLFCTEKLVHEKPIYYIIYNLDCGAPQVSD